MHYWPETYRVGVVGATGVVGRELLAILEGRGVAAESLTCIASERSAGSTLPFQGRSLPVEVLDETALAGLDIALFAAGAEVARTWGPRAVASGSIVIDNSSAFRGSEDVPLVLPEVNGSQLASFEGPGIIANPNCSTIIALMAVAPIHRSFGITRMNIATYQAVSGAGAAAMEELERQVQEHESGRSVTSTALPSQALFNVFNHESPVGPDGSNEEERKIRTESRRILGDPAMRISATCVRVGVPRAHSMAIELDLADPCTAAAARTCLEKAPGIRVMDDQERNAFPEPIHAAGTDDVLVGRIRNHPDSPDKRGLLLFACGDQIRKGAALNAIQILEAVIAADARPATRRD